MRLLSESTVDCVVWEDWCGAKSVESHLTGCMDVYTTMITDNKLADLPTCFALLVEFFDLVN